MRTSAVRTDFGADVGGPGTHRQAVVCQDIFHAQVERERKTRLWMEEMLQHDAVGLALGDGPGGPTDEAVNCVAPLRLVERKLQLLAVELVAAVYDPVWPRDQKLAPTRAAELLLAVAVQYRSVTVRVRAEAAADLDYDDTLVAVHELDLLARGCAPRRVWRNTVCAAGPRCSPPGSVLSRAHIYGYGRSLRPPQGTTIAPRRRAVSRQTLLAGRSELPASRGDVAAAGQADSRR